MENKDLYKIMKTAGEKHPKKHGEWYRLHVYDNHYLVLDTWNGHVYHYPDGAEPTSPDNMYRCVYTFIDSKGSPSNYERVKGHMNEFWYIHISHLRWAGYGVSDSVCPKCGNTGRCEPRTLSDPDGQECDCW